MGLAIVIAGILLMALIAHLVRFKGEHVDRGL